jgi:hypothetical protein
VVELCRTPKGHLFGHAVLLAVLASFLASPASAQDDHSNTANGATPLSDQGVSVPGAIEQAGDWDVFRLDATRGRDYVLTTARLAGGMDSILDLYTPAGQHLERNDDFGGSYASQISFNATETAAYWVVVSHYDRQGGTGSYSVSATRAGVAAPAAAPVAATGPSPAAVGTNGVTLSSAVLDPKLTDVSWSVTTRSAGSRSYTAAVSIYQGSQRVVSLAGGTRQPGRTYTDAWDGRDASGDFVAPGTYSVRFEADGVRSETELYVVRLGARSLEFVGRERVSLAFHRGSSSGWGSSALPVDSLGAAWTLNLSAHSAGCLDASTDVPLSGPAPWAGLDRPPTTSSGSARQRGRSLPVAYLGGGTLRVRLRLGASASSGGSEVSCGYPISGRPLRAVTSLGAGTLDASSEIQPDGHVTLDVVAVPSGVGKFALDLQLRFQSFDGSAWEDVPGYQLTRSTVYTVVGRPTSSMVPNATPWVAAVDLVADWSGGQATDGAGVLSACVRGVNTAGLRYDINYGASVYASGGALHNPSVDLGAFLDNHANGNVVNCSDCASLVSSLAAQVGAPSNVVVIGWNFDLNWLRGIGYSNFTHSLFGGNHAFSYHAWVSDTGGQNVYDACLSVDDDNRPWSAPHAEGLPQGMSWSHYRDQLCPTNVRIQAVGDATVR